MIEGRLGTNGRPGQSAREMSDILTAMSVCQAWLTTDIHVCGGGGSREAPVLCPRHESNHQGGRSQHAQGAETHELMLTVPRAASANAKMIWLCPSTNTTVTIVGAG